ncbi:MAG: hypothetical protein OEV73_01375 [Desulfobulbaceae bacterium]|nr:hypothetical protein [Desulfobulbaceae bacterium]
MRNPSNHLPHLILMACLLAALCMPLTARAAITTDDQNVTASDIGREANYSSLTTLVNNICDDAIVRFGDFFTPASVTVHPFVTIDDSPRGLSLLGVVLADQMLAMINNETSTRFALQHSATETQELTGLVQEMDGYLRIHIKGRNEHGEKRSHVVAVEMSEPLYRALHTTVSPGKSH